MQTEKKHVIGLSMFFLSNGGSVNLAEHIITIITIMYLMLELLVNDSWR